MKLTIQPDDDDNDGPHTKKRQTKILGWPTDTICIDFLVSRTSNRTVHEAHALHVSSTKNNPQKELQPTPENRPREVPHTVLCLIPGNPGQLDWYVSDLVNLVTKLGRGYAARAISHAGHSLNGGILDVEKYSKRNRDADKSIPWTVDGQILHKCAYLDSVISELNALQKDSTGTSSYPPPPPPPVRFLFLGHSFGCHVVQRMCILRPDILDRTDGFLYLMPFIRMDADRFIDQAKLNFGASSPETLISLGTGISHIAKILPVSWLDFFVRLSIQDDTINEIALRLLRQPTFAKNFFQLGTEEIRDIPSEIDVPGLRTLSKQCPIFMLFAGNDQWAPSFHMTDIAALQAKNILPSKNIVLNCFPDLRHDYSHQYVVGCSKRFYSGISVVSRTSYNSALLFEQPQLINPIGHYKGHQD